jgi:hypothetical protein
LNFRRFNALERFRESGIASMLYVFVFTQFRTQNRFALLLELLWDRDFLLRLW